MLKTIGDIFLVLSIIVGIVSFAILNANYIPPSKEEDDDKPS
mgnify:CR=1 FL=1